MFGLDSHGSASTAIQGTSGRGQDACNAKGGIFPLQTVQAPHGTHSPSCDSVSPGSLGAAPSGLISESRSEEQDFLMGPSRPFPELCLGSTSSSHYGRACRNLHGTQPVISR